MTKEMIISSNGHETRVAILEDDQLAEIFIERERNRGVVGNATRAASRRCCRACSRRSSTSAWSATASLRPDVITNLDELEGVTRGRAAGGERGGRREGPAGEGARPERHPEPKIEDLPEGQDVVVQVAKEPLDEGGASPAT